MIYFLLQLPSAKILEGYDQVGVPGILVGVIFMMIAGGAWFMRQIYTGKLRTEGRWNDREEFHQLELGYHKEHTEKYEKHIHELSAIIDRQGRQAEKRDEDFNRLTKEAQRLVEDIIKAKMSG